MSQSEHDSPASAAAVRSEAERPNALLLVDDEPQVCDGLRRVLHRDGYTIHVASGAEAAMSVLAAHGIDVIVSDQRMPGKKGTQLLAEVRDRYPNTVRMILSGAADVDEVAEAMRTGAISKFLTKPIDPALLRANVSEAFSRAAAQRASGAEESATDPSTGLATREGLERVFERFAENARQAGDTPCLLMLKVDQYDSVLSSFGSSFGQRFVRAVAEKLRSTFDAPYRLGQDAPGTFLLLTAARSPSETIAEIDRRLDELFVQPVAIGDRELTVTVSIGATATDGNAGFDELVDQSYAAMITGSERGGATLQLYQPHLVSRFRTQLELESELRQAVAAGAFHLYYQPQVDVPSGRIIGLEALLRWPHAERGSISPAEFIPVAERTGLIKELGEWVLETSVRQMSRWRDAGVAPCELAINVSPRQLKDTGFAAKVEKVLREHDWPAHRLVLELTESAALDNTIGECMDALNALGVTLAVDDFGTGYANLVTLTRSAFRKVKLDRSLLPPADDPRALRFYSNVVGMATELGLETVAEGVETPDELAAVYRSGCPVVQGYFYSAPVSPERLLRLLTGRFRSVAS